MRMLPFCGTADIVRHMPAPFRIAIADRSELAANLYKLLFLELEPELVIRKRFEDIRPHFFRRERIDLGIINSNIFGKKFEEIFHRIIADAAVRDVPKIFILRANPAEDEWRERLKKLPGSVVSTRPFHPDEFLKLVQTMLEKGRK